MMEEFPPEVTTIILSNLVQAKSILRCRAVCKTWCGIIDNPQFPQLHLQTLTTRTTTPKSGNTSSSSSSYILVPNFSNEICIAIEEDGDDNDEKVTLTSTKLELLCNKDKDFKLYVEPPINGLLFYSNSITYPTVEEDDFSMYICNPAIRDYVKLPNLETLQSRRSAPMFGFGFDVVNEKFKVVAIFVWMIGRDIQSEAQIYSLGSNSWTRLSDVPNTRFIRSGSAFVNGSLHWIARGDTTEDGLSLMKIVSFNLTSEHFGVVPSPDEDNILSLDESLNADSSFQLVELRGCLSIVDSSFDHHIDVWVMKDYNVKGSWSRFFVIKSFLDGMQLEWKTAMAITFRKDNEILLLCGSSTLVSYNTETGNFVPLNVVGLYNSLDIFRKFYGRAFPYIDSLISPKLAYGGPLNEEGISR